MKIVLPILLFTSSSLWVLAQDFQRVAPQASSSTILIDRNTDKNKMHEQMLYVLKNTTHKNYQAIYLILKAGSELVMEKKGSETFTILDKKLRYELGPTKGTVKSKNDLIMLVKALEGIETSKSNLCDELIRRIDPLMFGNEAKDEAIKLLSKWSKTKNNNLNKELLKRITSFAELGLIYYKVGDNKTLESHIKAISEKLPSIIGLDIEESERIKAITEIVFALQHAIEDQTFDNTKFPDSTSYKEVLEKTFADLKAKLKSNLIKNLGFDNPAVIYFDIFYAKLLVAIESLYQKDTSFRRALDANVGIISNDHLQTWMVNMIGNFVGSTLTKVVKNNERISWLNNLNLSDTATEVSTTIGFKVIDRPGLSLEMNGNFFYNNLDKSDSVKLRPDPSSPVEDTLKRNSLTSRMLIGLTLKVTLDNKDNKELGIYSAASAQVVGSLRNLDKTAPNIYTGLYIAFKPFPDKYPGFILRPYLEWIVLRRADYYKERVERYNVGLDTKLPDAFILSGFFINYQNNFGTTFGINFPIIK